MSGVHWFVSSLHHDILSCETVGGGLGCSDFCFGSNRGNVCSAQQDPQASWIFSIYCQLYEALFFQAKESQTP